MKDNLSLKFLLDEQERLISAEESVIQWRNTFVTHLFTGSGIAFALLANILRNSLSGASSPSYSLDWNPPILLIFLFMFFLSGTCWYRMLNGTATLSIIRAKRFYIKRELSKIGYRISGYYSDDINIADGGNTVFEQVTGFTLRTSAALLVLMTWIVILGAIISYIFAHVLIALPKLLFAIIVGLVLLLIGFWSFFSVKRKTIVRVERILGSLASQEINAQSWILS